MARARARTSADAPRITHGHGPDRCEFQAEPPQAGEQPLDVPHPAPDPGRLLPGELPLGRGQAPLPTLG
ncbi:hypothetical protein ACFCXH_18855 [Streptomyces nojiriensis]|uniref:hypothetical protein n=1 Tax=Streptomyces nojiriensis TaxID=66374 RepID=UPI0035D86302